MPGSQENSKTRELVVYLADKLAAQKNYGSILLNKALYFIDNINYLKTGYPISDFKYIKQERGPTPEPSQFLRLRSDLERSSSIEMVEAEYFGRLQKRLVAKRRANLDEFSSSEIALIDGILNDLRDLKGTQASDLSHQYPAWQVAGQKEVLPFYTFLITSKEASDEDIKWANSQFDGI